MKGLSRETVLVRSGCLYVCTSFKSLSCCIIYHCQKREIYSILSIQYHTETPQGIHIVYYLTCLNRTIRSHIVFPLSILHICRLIGVRIQLRDSNLLTNWMNDKQKFIFRDVYIVYTCAERMLWLLAAPCNQQSYYWRHLVVHTSDLTPCMVTEYHDYTACNYILIFLSHTA